jgi:hypothetical protein
MAGLRDPAARSVYWFVLLDVLPSAAPSGQLLVAD